MTSGSRASSRLDAQARRLERHRHRPVAADAYRRGVRSARTTMAAAASSAGSRHLRLMADTVTARTRPPDDGFGGRKPGAGEGIRTLDPNLGKVVLYP